MHPAIQLCLRHNGRVVLNRAIGHGWGNGPDDPPDAEKVTVTTETPFCAYSAAKAITTTVVHMLVERGFFSLDDRVCDYLPSYTSHGKDRTTIRHVMTHSAGMPFHTGPAAGPQAHGRQRVHPREARRAEADLPAGTGAHLPRADVGPAGPRDRLGRHGQEHSRDPGRPRSSTRSGSGGPTTALRRRMFRWSPRATPRASRCLRRSRRSSGWPSAERCRRSSRSRTPRSTSPSVLPSSNTVSTADELSRFAEILRRGGELDGVRVMQPGDPARRDEPSAGGCGRMSRWGWRRCAGAPGTCWGRTGSGRSGAMRRRRSAIPGLTNIAVWADPERGLSAGLISSGKPGPHREANRYPALLDRITAEIPRAD